MFRLGKAEALKITDALASGDGHQEVRFSRELT